MCYINVYYYYYYYYYYYHYYYSLKKGNYFVSLNNFIHREKGRCSKVYNFIEICITHGMCVDHMARQKEVGFIYIYISLLLVIGVHNVVIKATN